MSVALMGKYSECQKILKSLIYRLSIKISDVFISLYCICAAQKIKFVIFTKETLNGKFHFLCSVTYYYQFNNMWLPGDENLQFHCVVTLQVFICMLKNHPFDITYFLSCRYLFPKDLPCNGYSSIHIVVVHTLKILQRLMQGFQSV